MRFAPDGPVDLVTAAYALNELRPDDAVALLDRVWPATAGALVLVEPGTPAAYERMMVLRARLVELGATILAPCPHDGPCPLQGDWCHFAVRLARSSAHRAAKGARRGFEDEKFTYVVATRVADADRDRPRILRHPLVRPGHVRFRLCTRDGIGETTVARTRSRLPRRAQGVVGRPARGLTRTLRRSREQMSPGSRAAGSPTRLRSGRRAPVPPSARTRRRGSRRGSRP